MRCPPSLLSAAVIAIAIAGCISHDDATAQTPAPAPAAPATSSATDTAQRAAVVEEIAALLESRYVFPETGARYAAALRQVHARGALDTRADAAAFAESLTRLLQSVTPDGHLRVRVEEGGPRSAEPAARSEPALADARMLPGGVAYLRFNLLASDPAVVATARDFLLAHADAKAVVIDARTTRGGTMAVMNAVLPLLYKAPTTLVRMDTRLAAAAELRMPDAHALVRRGTDEDVLRRDHVVQPHASESRLIETPVFFLTSARTASAAEHLALALKRTGRGTLVGQTTRGAGHFGGFASAGEFEVFVPVGRTYDPDTGEGWEGTGIHPDVAVAPEAALETALRLAGLDDDTLDRAVRDARLAAVPR